MKTIKRVWLLFMSLVVGTGSALAQNVDLHWTSPVKERYVTFYAEPHGTPPEEMSYLIEPANPDPKFQEAWEKEAQTNHNLVPKNRDVGLEIFNDYKKAVWVPFKTNLLVDFGPGDGERWLRVRFRNRNDDLPHWDNHGGFVGEANPNWDAHYIVVQTSPLFVVITNPKQKVTPQPTIQLKGYSPVPIVKLRYDVLDQNGNAVRAGEGWITDQYYDPVRLHFTTNYFECLDIDLSPGTNTIRFHCEDGAGNTLNTNLIFVFTTVGDTNPPAFSVTWPQDGTSVSGSQFDLYGRSDDDPTAIVTGLLTDDAGKSSHLNGFVERNGCLWIERVPVGNGKSYLTVVATDAAQNSSLTNLMFVKSGMTLYMDPVADPNLLWQPRITVTGYCSDTNRTVSVSGVKATMKPDGHWLAKNVPVNSPNGGGTATFDITTDDDNDNSAQTNSWLPAICSPAVENNALSAGLSLLTVGTNHYNHYPISLGLTNTSGRNLPGTWMLPKAEGRFLLRLYDSTNQEVAKKEWTQKSGEALATNLNIHHLGKSELEQIDGIIAFRTNSTACTASLNLDEHFQRLPPGDYRLEVILRMFKIATDGRLIPFEFPPLSTPIKIIDQPSDMAFYLDDLQRQGKLTWGAERYGLRIGVAHGMKWMRIEDANQIEIFLLNSSTNDFHNWNLRFPDPKEQFDVTLYDAGGKEVPKTALGKQQGQPLSLDGQKPGRTGGLMNEVFGNDYRNGVQIRPVFVSAKDATECERFDLNDYFKITTPGKYRLTYQERLYRWNTNSILTGVILPTVAVPLDISYVPGL
jgi:hypothetical protein